MSAERSSSEKQRFISVSITPQGDGIYLDIAGGKFFAQSACKGIDPAFACRIGNFAGSSDISPYRRNIDDMSGFGMNHGRDDLSAGGKDGCEVCRNYLIPVGNIHVGEQTDIRDAGIVD